MMDEGGDREEILYVLTSIIRQYGLAKLKVGNEVLLLRYVWNDVDRVSHHQFIVVLSFLSQCYEGELIDIIFSLLT